MQEQQQQQQYQRWSANQPGYSLPQPPHHSYQTQPQVQGPSGGFAPQTNVPTPPQKSETSLASRMKTINENTTDNQKDNANTAPVTNIIGTQSVERVAKAITLAEAGTRITFDAMQKFVSCLMGSFVLRFCTVSPRTFWD